MFNPAHSRAFSQIEGDIPTVSPAPSRLLPARHTTPCFIESPGALSPGHVCRCLSGQQCLLLQMCSPTAAS